MKCSHMDPHTYHPCREHATTVHSPPAPQPIRPLCAMHITRLPAGELRALRSPRANVEGLGRLLTEIALEKKL